MTDAKKPWEEQYGGKSADGGSEPWKQDFGPDASSAPAAPRGLKGWGQDIAATAVKGAIAVPEALVGLADIPTGGAVGKALENEGGAFGFRPKEAKEIVNEWHSDATKEAQRKFQAADGIVDKAGVALSNPSLIATAVGESLPSMGAGGVAARGLLAVAPKVAPWVAGAVGEGVVGAGSAAEQIRQETKDGLLTPTQAGLSLASGAATTAFGALGNKVANRLGIGEADTMLAQGIKGMNKEAADKAATAAANPLVAEAAVKGIPRQVIEGAISEGFLEELPQSMAEQIFQNIALDKPWYEELDSAAVMGVLSGGAMGAGAAGFKGVRDSFGQKAQPGDAPGEEAPADTDAPPAAPNPGLKRVSDEFALRLQALQQQEQGELAVPQTAPPDAAAALARQQAQAQAERDAQIAASRAVSSPDDEILESTGAAAPRPSEAMGLRPGPAAGTMENAAALAVDSGVTAQLQQASMLAQAAEQVEKAKPADKKEQEAPEVNPETGEIGGMDFAQWSDADLSDLYRTAQAPEVRRQLAMELSSRRTRRQEAQLQAELQADLTASEMPEGGDGAFASVQEDAGAVPDSIEIQGASSEAPAAPGVQAQGANVATLAQLNRKVLPDMSTDELHQLASLLPADHARQKKIQKEIQARAKDAPGTATNGAQTNGLETAQTKPAGAQPAQAGAAPAAAGSAPQGQGPARAGAAPATAAKGLTNGAAPTANPGAQAAPAPSAQAQTQEADRAQRAQRLDDAGASWTRMPVAERQAVAKRLDGVKPIIAKNLPNSQWANLNGDLQRKIADAIQPIAAPEVSQAAVDTNVLRHRTQVIEMITRDDGDLTPEGEAIIAKLPQDLLDAAYQYRSVQLGLAEAADILEGADLASAEKDLSATLKKLSPKISELYAAIDALSADDDRTSGKLPYVGPAVATQQQSALPAPKGGAVSVTEAAHEAATSQRNDLDAPTEAQIEAGNYKKGHVRINGLDISIENPAGSKRRPEWPALKNHYGYLKGTVGADKDHVDVFLTDRATDPSLPVFVVDQVYRDGTFDEHKVVLGADNETAARQTYLDNYAKGWTGLGAITQMTQDQFKAWVSDAAMTKKPAGKIEAAKAPAPATAKKPSADQTRAKADLMNALADLGDILGKNTRMNMVPEQEQRLLPVLTRVLDAAFRLGYHKFKDAAKFSLDQIREHLGAEAAGALTLDHLQGAYIAMAGGKKGVDTKRAVIDVEDKADIEAHTATSVLDAADEAGAVPVANGASFGDLLHGSAEQFDAFKIDGAPRGVGYDHQGRGVYLTSDPGYAAFFARAASGRAANRKGLTEAQANAFADGDGAQMNVKLAPEAKILDMRQGQVDQEVKRLFDTSVGDKALAAELRQRVMDLGYDGLAFTEPNAPEGWNVNPNATTVVVYRPELAQIQRTTPEGETEGAATISPGVPQIEEKGNERTTIRSDGPQALGQVAAAEGGRPESRRGAGASTADGRQGNAAGGAGPDATGLPAARSGGSGPAAVRPAQARAGRQPGALGAQGDGSAGARVPEVDGRVAVPGGEASAPNIPAADFQITADVGLGKGGEVQKFNDNLAAITTLKRIEAENRRATPDEQALLARYVGWGGLANAFPEPISGNFKDKWKERGEQLRDLLTKEEYTAARRSTRNAHYTSQTVVSAMWDMVRRLGYRGGLVLESSMGTGNFLGLAPKDMANQFVGIEYDSLTARIGQALYPQATVLHSGFQKVPVADNAFMLNIGNPPFGSESLRFQYKPELQGVSIHNQFFRAGMDALRPGGLQAMVVSRFLMDAQDKSTRLALAQQAKLVSAFRLPDTAFKENARTEVVTDILIFQKLDAGEQAAMQAAVAEYRKVAAKKKDADEAAAALVPAWVETVQVPDPLGGEPMTVNAYFRDNARNVLGVMERSGSMQHGADITVRLDKQTDLGALLREATNRLPENVHSVDQQVLDGIAARHKGMSDALRIAVSNEEAGHVKSTPEGLQRVIERETPEGDFEFAYQPINENSPWSEALSQDANGKWYVLEQAIDADGKKLKVLGEDGTPTRRNLYERKVFDTPADVPESMRLGKLGMQRLQGLVGLRDLLKRQLVLETADAAQAVMEGNRKALAKAYEAFVKANGPVNRATNLKMAMTMPDGGLVAALEVGYQPARSADQAARSGLPAQKEQAQSAPILRERVVPKYEPATKAATASDALAITLAERGRVDLERIASLLGVNEAEAAQQLQKGADPLVFQDPETQAWETADAYLSGMVKRKLNAARAAGLAQNVQALEKVIPADWTAENVAATMGATWVPADVYGEFVQHLAGGKARVSFSALTNSFNVTVNSSDRAALANWSTEGAPVDYIVSRILNSKAVTVTARDADGNTYIDKEKTALAGLKAREIEAEFGDWVFKDGERRQRLVDIFNEKFNTRVVRQFNGQHLQLPGKVPDTIIKMRRHQMNAIWRGIYERFTLVDHAVGAGKTFTAIARAMERRRMGLSRKPMIVVPNHLVEQWEADVYRLYPGAKVLAAGKKDFEAKRRRRLFGKIATGDWDIVIVPHSSFGFIGIAPETESRYLEQEMAQAQAAIEDAWEQAREDGQDTGRRKPFNVKEAERLAEKIQGRMDRLAEGVRDRLLTFEQLGVDDMSVDEAHEFKNLYYSSNLTGVRGMGDKTGSRKANDLYNKVRVLRDQPTGSVTFLTGTPISNSAVEMFTMLRYLAADSLQEMGLTHFDAFRAQFVEATPAFEPTESGRLKQVTRLGRTWSNMRSLMDLYYQTTDAVSLEDIKRFYAEDNNGAAFPVPKIAGGKDRQLVPIKPTPAQDAELKAVMDSFDELDDIQDPYERNAERLRLMDRARKLSLDIRAVDPRSASQEEGGKLQVVAENIKRIYDKWTPDLGTQLVFLDRSVPKAKGDDKILKEYDDLVAKRSEALRVDDQEAFDEVQEALDRYDANEIAELRLAQSSPWSAYQQIKNNLIAAGIPAEEIRFVQEANNDEQKAALFDAVNGGKVRVLLGSTPRMGAGTNVQQRIVALHHVDVTWKPSDIEQREGRAIRQGNKLLEKYGEDFEVELLAYATERTVDAKMWDLNATKLRTINGIRKYDGAFSMEFEDEEAVGMAEMAALASGNPMLLERVKVESEIQTLELQERAHRRKMWSVEDELQAARNAIERNPGRIEAANQRRAQAEQALSDLEAEAASRSVTVEGQAYSTVRDAFAAAEEAIKALQGGNDKARYALTIDGKRVTTKEAVSDQITGALGDVDSFAATVGGKTFTQRTAAAREVAERMNKAMKGQTELSNLPVGQMLGYDLVADFLPMQLKDGTTVHEPSLTLMDGDRTIASHSGNVQAGELSGTNLRGLLQSLANDIHRNARSNEAEYLAQGLERAKRDLPGLEARKGEGFPKAQELADKRKRLAELVSLLEGKATAQPTTEAQAEGLDGQDDAHAGAALRNGAGTATDRALMDMVREGKPAQDLLQLIAGTSKSRFNKQVARLLTKAKVSPTVVLEAGALGGDGNFTFLARYRRSNDTIGLTAGAQAQAEQILLHEMIHAATLKALDRKGVASLQMRKLYEHVKKQGGANGTYGMKNVGEFVAEAFTNPEFQHQLKQMSAPQGNVLKSAWDSLVRILHTILGLPVDSTNALSQALTLGVEVMRENVALRRRQAAAAGAGPDVAHFGTAELKEIQNRSMAYVHDAMNQAPGTVHWWHKTVGTMNNLAERNPAFKPVYQAAQQFTDDVSSLANDVANQAPRLIPRLESLGDLKFWGKDARKPISGEDNTTIAKPLFEGTLMWTRDIHGKPVTVDALEKETDTWDTSTKEHYLIATKELSAPQARAWQGLPLAQYEKLVTDAFKNKVLKPGIRWTDAELRSMFKLSDGQLSLFKEARSTIDASIDTTARADMMRMIGEEYRDMREAVMEAPTLDDALTLVTRTLQDEAKANPDSSERLMALHNSVVAGATKARDLIAKGYAPLSRFGSHTVDVLDAKGERLYFGLFETAREADAMQANMAEVYKGEPGVQIGRGTLSKEEYKLFAGVTPESLEAFGTMLGLDTEGNEAKDAAFQEYIRRTKNNHSALKRLIHRKGIAGYSQDVGRVLASFVYSNARQGAGALNAGIMEKAIQEIPKQQGQLRDVAMGLRSYIQDPQEEGQAVRGFLFAQYLGGSVASAVVNMLQPVQITFPWLSQYGGVKQAGAQLTRAFKDMATVGKTYEPDLAKALKRAEDEGTVSPQEIHQLMAQARGEASLRAGDGTALGNARATASNAWRRTVVAWGQPFAWAEQLNRRSTFIAAYRIAVAEKMADPDAFAAKAVKETQFQYSKANKMRWGRGAIGGTLMTFKSYSVSYLELMGRMWNAGTPGSPQRAQSRKALLLMVGMLALMGGAGGLPFVEDVEDLVNGLMNKMGYNWDSKQARKQFLQQLIGQAGAEFINSGISGLPGMPIDVAGRLGMGNLLPGTGLVGPQTDKSRDLLEVVGPAGDFVKRIFNAGGMALGGNVGGAALEVSPGAVRNWAKGYDMATSGMYKDGRGYKVIDTNLGEALSKFIGFQPRAVADVQEANGVMQKSRAFYTQQSADIKAQWADALFRKDEAALESVRERLASWNRKNPYMPIVVQMPQIWKKVREMGKDKQQRIAETAPKALRQQMREMAREAGGAPV